MTVNDYGLMPMASCRLSVACPLAYIATGTSIHKLTHVVLLCKE